MKATASCLLTGVLRTTTLAIVIASWITWAALPAVAQNTVPSSATQAAKMPQFASRLSHAAKPQASVTPPSGRLSPPGTGPVYDNGPVNGQVDAFNIGIGGLAVTDSIQLSGSGSLTGLQFWAWLIPGDVVESVQVSIGSAPFGSDQFNETVFVSQSNCFINTLGFNVCLESGHFDADASGAWVTLQNANAESSNPVYWDENSGVGCTSSGCPSQAEEREVGTIPSEAFSIEGYVGPTCYQSAGNLQTLTSLSQQDAGPYPGPNGVVIDNVGNLYGTALGGRSNAGFAYKLAHFADWLLEPLFNFVGGDAGGPPTGAIIGQNGSLYGGAPGGIQNCGSDGSQYCGLVYNLRPKPTICAIAQCGWNENVPYRFTGESDGSGVINVSAHDQQGNLYGTTSTGGTHGAGTVFELSPAVGGWEKTTLYSFTGGSDGTGPTQVLYGNDGNLYGTTNNFGAGVVFQLMSSGGQWSESVVHSGAAPSNLVQDSAGNLYGTRTSLPYSPIFALVKTGSQWSYSEYAPQHDCQGGDLPYSELENLTIDTAGNVYGTGTGGMNTSRNRGTRSPGFESCFYNFIFKARYDSGGWHYDDLWFHANVLFTSGGSLALDSSGKLYGTTSTCGTNNAGTVWQLSP